MRIAKHLAAASLIAGFLVTTGVGGFAQEAGASGGFTYYVNSASDTGATAVVCEMSSNSTCGIDDAIAAFNSDSMDNDADTIDFSSFKNTFSVGAPTAIDNSNTGVALDIVGNGESSTVVTGGLSYTVFDIDSSSTVSISGITIEDGSAAFGGGVSNAGTVTLTNDTLSNDSAADSGGGVENTGTATLTNDTLSNDSADYGAGVNIGGGTATLTNDTFSDDSAVDSGGGVSNAGTVTLTNDTLSNDSATYGGGVNIESGSATLTNDTLSNDSATYGGGVSNGATATVANSILDAASCNGTIGDGGYNVESDNSCFGSDTDDVENSSTINLAALLAANGSSGPETLAIGPSSSALEEVPMADCTVTTDERDLPRPGLAGQNCDAGAYEAQAQTVTLYVASTGTATTGCTDSLNPCTTVQEGVTAAEQLVGTVTVDVAAGTYDEHVTVAMPSGDTLTLEGAGADSTFANGGANGAVFTISSGVVTIDGINIEDGLNPDGGGVDNAGTVTLTNDTISNDSAADSGGGVDNTGTATLTNDTISNDSADYGGGVENTGTATLTNDTFSDDSAVDSGGGVENTGTATLTNDTISNDSADYGGGVENTGTATLTNDTFSDDSAFDSGGGVENTGTATLTNDTISNDSADYGGGVNIGSGTATLTNDTFSDDSAVDSGGGVSNAGTATLTNDTFSDDSADYGGGVNIESGSATLTNDTFSDDLAADYGGGVSNGATATLTNDTFWNDFSLTTYGGGVNNGATATVANSILDASPCSGAIGDGGYNVESDNSCFGSDTDDVENSSTINLPVSSLAANGSSGPETLAIGPSSSAFEEVPLADCTVTTDERDLPRPGLAGQNCDAGAYEYQLPTIATTPDPSSAFVGSTLQDSATLGNIYNLSGSGEITFNLYGPGDTSCADSLFSTTVSDVRGDGPYSTTSGSPATGYLTTAPGTYNWTASYSGDPSNADVGTTCGSESVTVEGAASPTLTTTPSVTSATFGATTTLKDTAHLAGGDSPTGTITFTLYNEVDTLLDTEIVTVTGNGTYATPSGYRLPTTGPGTVAGTYQWDVTYTSSTGDNNNASDNNATDEQVVVSPASTSLTLNGPTQTAINSSFSPMATLSSSAAACYQGQPVTFTLSANPLTGLVGTYTLETSPATVNTTSAGLATGSVSTSKWLDGVYTITANYAGTSNCGSSSSMAALSVTAPGLAVFGGGRYVVPRLGNTNFGFEASLAPKSKTAYVGQLDVITPGYWMFQANVTSDGITSATQALLGGTGTLYWWNTTLNKNHGGWSVAASNLTYKATANAATKTAPASFGIQYTFTPGGSEPKVTQSSPPETLSSGGIISI